MRRHAFRPAPADVPADPAPRLAEVATAAANASQDSAEDDPLLEGKHNVLLVADFIQASLLKLDVDRFFAAELPSSTVSAPPPSNSASSIELDLLLARLAKVVAHPASTSGHNPGHDASFAASAHPLLKSPVLNRSRPIRLPSPAKSAPPPVAERKGPYDDFDAMDESSVDLSMSMEMDQTTNSAGGGVAPSSPSETSTAVFIETAPNGNASTYETAQTTAVVRPSELPNLPAIAEGLVGAVRKIVTNALPPVDSVEDDPQSSSDLRALGRLLRVRRVDDEPLQLAIVVGDDPSSSIRASFSLVWHHVQQLTVVPTIPFRSLAREALGVVGPTRHRRLRSAYRTSRPRRHGRGRDCRPRLLYRGRARPPHEHRGRRGYAGS